MSSSQQTRVGSLRDRIAKFNNPDSTPLVPQSAFGYGAPIKSDSSQLQDRGLIGNRIPSYNAKNIAPDVIAGSRKKVENRGLYGNRIPALTKPDGLTTPGKEPLPLSDGELSESQKHGAAPNSSDQGNDKQVLQQVGNQETSDEARRDGGIKAPAMGTLLQRSDTDERDSRTVGGSEGIPVAKSQASERQRKVQDDTGRSDEVKRPSASACRTMASNPDRSPKLSHSILAQSGQLGNYANPSHTTSFSTSGLSVETVPLPEFGRVCPCTTMNVASNTGLQLRSQDYGTIPLQPHAVPLNTEVKPSDIPLPNMQCGDSMPEGMELASSESGRASQSEERAIVSTPTSLRVGNSSEDQGLDAASGPVILQASPVAELQTEGDARQEDPAVSDFHRQFTTAKTDLQDMIKAGRSTSTDRHAAAEKLSWMRTELNKANDYLPRYDQSRYQEQIEELDLMLRPKKQPRKPFNFKKATPARHISDMDNTEKPSPLLPKSNNAGIERDGSAKTSAACVHRLEDKRDEYITLANLELYSDPSSDYFSLTMDNVEGCIIDLCDTAILPALSGRSASRQRRCTALYMSKVKNTIIVIGHSITGSVLLHKLEDCLVVLGAQQFRLHDSVRCTVLLAAHSTPAIEKSRDIKFGVYPDELKASEDQTSDADYQVNDFDWLREGPSPHWSWQKSVRWPFTTLTHATDLNVTRSSVLRAYLPRTAESHRSTAPRPPNTLFYDRDMTHEETGWAKVQTTRTKYC